MVEVGVDTLSDGGKGYGLSDGGQGYGLSDGGKG